jgi:hypothetical protein
VKLQRGLLAMERQRERISDTAAMGSAALRKKTGSTWRHAVRWQT